MNTIKKIAVLVIIASMTLGCFVFGSSAEAQQAYVTDGLVAWYDASNNSNGSFDAQANTWKDLSGNGNHIDVSSALSAGQISWADGKLVINKDTGCQLVIPSKVVNALTDNAYTIEIVTGQLSYTATSYITLLCSANDDLSVFVRCAASDNMKLEYKNQDSNGDDNRPYVYDSWNYFNAKTLTITSDLNKYDGVSDISTNPNQEGNVHMYSDGVQIGKGESHINMVLDTVYFGHTASHRRWGGDVYSLRIYNRALTEDEVKANTAADTFNYRSGKTIEPTQKYDPELDKPPVTTVVTTTVAPNTTPTPITTKLPEQTTAPTTQPSDKKSGGCKGAALTGLCAVIATTLFGGVAVLKKKKED